MAYWRGDMLTDMIQSFRAMALLSSARLEFREIIDSLLALADAVILRGNTQLWRSYHSTFRAFLSAAIHKTSLSAVSDSSPWSESSEQQTLPS